MSSSVTYTMTTNFCTAVCKSGLYCRCYSKKGYDRCTRHLQTCPICYEHIESEQETIVLGCKHTYCKSCIKRWLGTNITCPTCRSNVPWEFIVELTGRNILPFPSFAVPEGFRSRYLNLLGVLRNLMNEYNILSESSSESSGPTDEADDLARSTIRNLENLINIVRSEEEEAQNSLVSP